MSNSHTNGSKNRTHSCHFVRSPAFMRATLIRRPPSKPWTGHFENQLIETELPDTTVIVFTYDGFLKRVQRDDGTTVTKYLWDDQNVLQETDDSLVVEAVYTVAPQASRYGTLVSQERDSASSFYQFDAVGSTIQLTDETGVVTDDYVYTAFGEVESSTGSSENPYQWIGREGYYLDPGTARYNLRRREYQANIARFLQQDPLGLEAGDANLYRYVENDPVNRTDPSGLQGAASAALPAAIPWEGGGGLIIPPMPPVWLNDDGIIVPFDPNPPAPANGDQCPDPLDCLDGSDPLPEGAVLVEHYYGTPPVPWIGGWGVAGGTAIGQGGAASGRVIGTVITALGAWVCIDWLFSSGTDEEFFDQTWDSVEDAIGETSLLGADVLSMDETTNERIYDAGYTEAWRVQGSDGTIWTVFRNPTTGKFGGAHQSSHQGS